MGLAIGMGFGDTVPFWVVKVLDEIAQGCDYSKLGFNDSKYSPLDRRTCGMASSASADATTDALKSVIHALTVDLTAAESRAATAEAKLVEAQSQLTELSLSVGPAQQHRHRLELEKAEVERRLDAQRAQTVKSAADAMKMKAERDAARASLHDCRLAADDLIPNVCELLLHAQSQAEDEPKLEADLGKLAASSDAADAHQQLIVSQANFAAALNAFGESCRRNAALSGSAFALGKPLSELRAAVRGGAANGAAVGEHDAALRAAAGMHGRRLERRASNGSELASDADDDEPPAGPSGAAGKGPRAVASATARVAGSAGGSSNGAGGGGGGGLVSRKFDVVVPEGAVPGDTLYVTLPSGEQVKVVLPPDVAAGAQLTCSALTLAV